MLLKEQFYWEQMQECFCQSEMAMAALPYSTYFNQPAVVWKPESIVGTTSVY